MCNYTFVQGAFAVWSQLGGFVVSCLLVAHRILCLVGMTRWTGPGWLVGWLDGWLASWLTGLRHDAIFIKMPGEEDANSY